MLLNVRVRHKWQAVHILCFPFLDKCIEFVCVSKFFDFYAPLVTPHLFPGLLPWPRKWSGWFFYCWDITATHTQHKSLSSQHFNDIFPPTFFLGLPVTSKIKSQITLLEGPVPLSALVLQPARTACCLCLPLFQFLHLFHLFQGAQSCPPLSHTLPDFSRILQMHHNALV